MNCSICLEQLETQHSLDCGHSFHPSCIVNWFRRGHDSCPECRDVVTLKTTYMDVWSRAKLVIRIATKKNGDKKVKKAYLSYKKTKENFKKIKEEHKLFKREHREIINKFHTLRRTYWQLRRRERDKRRQLGLMACEGLPSII
ncbi:MAG: hypothetical protein CMM25_02830 [Rhodospirillaceae bacterium]|nr:hypothetical protein [Rhodospirillaceae bacterium]|tara:strand:- start:587 stop:1015 length:429 start_codon:yes stop_codon:yes gene_type:complete